ncbi:MAG: DUF6151 family protein [Rudaea sp.]
MNHRLKCGCGKVEGYVALPGVATRAVCYCKDCQAFARFLDRADRVLDSQGGTGIVATLPRQVVFTSGAQNIACMSLSARGMLRWYASCCNTPIGNTPRDAKISYVGLVDDCLAREALDASFGAVRMVLNTRSANGEPKPAQRSGLFAMIGIMKAVIGSRLSGAYRRNPFFSADGRPIAEPRELSKDERAHFTEAA